MFADLLLKWVTIGRRRFGEFLGVALFVPVAEAVVYFGIDPPGSLQLQAGIGAGWLAFLFAGLWLVEEMMREEWDTNAFQIYVLARKEGRFYWEWMLTGGGALTLLGGVCWFVAFVLYGVPVGVHFLLVVVGTTVVAFGTAGLAVFVRLIAVASGMGSFLGPLLLFPLLSPLVLAGTQAFQAAMIRDSDPNRWMLLGLFFGILYALLGSWAVPHLLKE